MTHADSSCFSLDAIKLPTYALALLSLLEDAGYEAWCVGGFVRDALLGRDVNDVDIATNALWHDVKRVCEAQGLRVHETGTRHGTVTVVNPAFENATIEVTTFRADGAYRDARHPSSVTFVRTIEEDLARRDFTVNALAYHPTRGLVDPFGGFEDLARRIIRVVGDPERRFSEDALRILRACRFRSQLGFSIDEATYAAMVSHKSLLANVSAERVTHEIDGLLLGPHVHDALMETVDVLAFVLPELAAMKGCAQVTKYHIYDVLEHTAYVVQNTPAKRLVRWAALCHDMGKPAAAFFAPDGVEHFYGHAHVSVALARGIMDRFLVSNAFKEQVLTLVRIHDDTIAPTKRAVRRAIARLDGNVELFYALCDLKRADSLSQASFCAERAEAALELKRIADEIEREGAAFTCAQLAIDGRDVIAAGIPEGPAVGAMLQAALEAVIDEQVPNERAELLAFVRRRCAQEEECAG